MKGVSANVMCGQEGYYGTSSFKVLIDNDFIMTIKPNKDVVPVNEKMDEKALMDQLNAVSNNECSTNNLLIQSTVSAIQNINMGKSDDYELDF